MVICLLETKIVLDMYHCPNMTMITAIATVKLKERKNILYSHYIRMKVWYHYGVKKEEFILLPCQIIVVLQDENFI